MINRPNAKRTHFMYINKIFLCLTLSCFLVTPHGLAQGSGGNLWSPYQKLLTLVIEKLDYKVEPKLSFFSTGVDMVKLRSKGGKALIKSQVESLKKAFIPKTKVEQLAFWINAYNFFTLLEIQTHPKIESMKDLGWKRKIFQVGTKKYSLDQIEHEIVRPLGEPRIHFVINCASVGCPSLLPEVLSAQKLEKQLQTGTFNALKNPLHARMEKLILRGNRLNVTKLFSWFGDDFKVKPYGSIEGFLKAFVPSHLKKEGDNYSTSISYDWNLYSTRNIKAKMKELAKEFPDLKLRSSNKS